MCRYEKSEREVTVIQRKAAAMGKGHLAGAVALNRGKQPVTTHHTEASEQEK